MTKPYVVFMCPRCRHFTNAPLGQKRRRCSYCGHIIDITSAATALFDDPNTAAEAVRQFNARGDKEFEEAVRRSRERVLALIPARRLSVEDVADEAGEMPLPSAKTQRLILMLVEKAKEQPCNLDELEAACKSYRLEWEWVENQLTKLFNAGDVFFPNPWTVRYIGEGTGQPASARRRVDVSAEILAHLRSRGDMVPVKDIMREYAEKGVSEESVEESLDKLMRKGEIFQPRPGHVRAV
ncbi:MAG: hypothetical protein ACTSPX_00225 [Candidatus Thorarchaeota archaeon]